MTEEQKSLLLAWGMHWDTDKRSSDEEYHIIRETGEELKPYESCDTGLAQFAKIILAFPSFVDSFHTEEKLGRDGLRHQGWKDDKLPDQERLLDEILMMKGVEL